MARRGGGSATAECEWSGESLRHETSLRPGASVAGDLDAIVLRAMSKQPEARYGSAEELAEDVGRFLADFPDLVARGAIVRLRHAQLAARHKAAFVSIGVSVVLIIATLIVAIWQAQVATVERRRTDAIGEVRQLASVLISEIHDAVAPLAGYPSPRQTIVAKALSYLERLAGERGRCRP